jgi:fumarate reductase flavoprotein subunit
VRSSEVREVAVVGAGLAGVCCAAALASAGVDVVLLESEAVPGGSARWAVGSLTAAGTRWQRAAGILDGPEAHVADLLAMCAVPDPAYVPLLRRMCADGAATLDWLAARGVEFAGPFLEPPHGRPRMHNAVPAAAALVPAALGDLPVRTRARVETIERDGDGFVLGDVRARAVVIASGDRSSADPDLPGVNPAATGVPITAAVALGALSDPAIVAPGLRMATPSGAHVAPTDELVGVATVVDGERRLPGGALLADPPAFTGRDLHLEVDERAVPDPARLATYPAVGYGDLARFVSDGLAHRAEGTVRIGPLRVVVTLADGALRVDEDLRVRSAVGGVVPGLWACGSAALGPTQLNGHGHHLLWAATTGRWAAAALLAENVERSTA